MTHFITLKKAIDMTALYRQEKENILCDEEKGKDILPICETFEVDSLKDVLNQDGCVKVRIYYGMDENKKTHAILVGVNDQDEDILPTSPTNPDSKIMEDSVRCPIVCPPSSPLSS